MRKTVRVHATLGPEERLAGAIRRLPRGAQEALVTIADREDLPLVAGSWEQDQAGCLVANVVRALAVDVTPDRRTFDLRVLDLLPELSSKDLNDLIVAWDEAAAQEGRGGDPALRRLLRGALARAGVPSGSVVGADPAQLDLHGAGLAVGRDHLEIDDRAGV